MKKTFSILTILVSALALPAQTAEKATIAVAKVGATTALVNDMRAKGTTSAMERVVQSIDANLSAALQATRKFSVLSRSDIDIVLKEQDFAASGNVSAVSEAAKSGSLKGAKYVVSVLVDDFQDYVQKENFATIGKTLETRKIRIGAIANVINATTGEIAETANFIITNDGISDRDLSIQTSGGSSTDSLTATLARGICSQIAGKVADVAFPAKILAKTGKFATFNRGEGMGVSVGDVYEIFAAGEEIKDPDTGEVLGSEEIPVGKMRVVSVGPKFSRAEVFEDTGVAKLQKVKLAQKAGGAAK